MDKHGQNLLVALLFLGIIAVGGIVVAATVSQIDSSDPTPSVEIQLAPTASQVETPTLSHDDAITIAKQTIQGVPTESSLERYNNQLVYSVEVEKGSIEHDVLIDAHTGAVVKVERETDLGRQELDLIQTTISEEDAKFIALGRVPGTIQEIDIEKINGVYVYEVEIDSTSSEFDVTIDLLTGKVLSIQEEIQEKPTESSTSAPVSIQEAKQIALAEIGGGSVGEVDNDRVGGIDAWEVEVRYSGNEYDVLINKQTGQVLDVEED